MKNFKRIRTFLIIFFLSAFSATIYFYFNSSFNSSQLISGNTLIYSDANAKSEKIAEIDSFSDDAPELNNKNGKWINTEKEISLEDLKGKVTLIEFWTFGCYNCTNTLPYLNKWYDKYKSENFEMIGIHCPEFDNERNFENVKRNVEELEIKYPVLTDNEFSIWQKYDVHAWPTIFIIDKKGEIRYKKVGEGKYDKTEEMIQTLLKEPYESGSQK
ncbi:MAG: redoxin domain-containing protein [Ignavibacteria bacterium]